MDPFPALVIVVFFLLGEAFFSGSEFVLISFNRMRLRHLAESGIGYAVTLENLLKTPDRVFGTTSVGTNICVFAGASVVTSLFVARVGPDADFYSFLIMGPVTLVLGEIVPKMLARKYMESSARYMGKPLAMAQTAFAPILAVTSFISKLVLRIFLRLEEIPAGVITRDEILRLAKMSEGKFDLAHEEKKMIGRIFEFRASPVETAMKPLIKVVAVPAGSTLAEVKKRVAETGFSRLPVFHERIYKIVGIISAFDIMSRQDYTIKVDELMKPPLYTPLTKKNADLLKEMKENGEHMAVVVDEYGAAAGIVTMEDLVEEIVGEIEDEYDKPVKFYEKLEDGRYIIDAMTEIDTLNEELGLDIPTGDYETISGFLIDALERIPAKRERVAIGSYLITVLDADPRVVKSIELLDLRAERKEGAREEPT